jgi:MFS family permease
MYSLVIAHTNDYLQPHEIVPASSAIAILVGIGAICGPILSSTFMKALGADGFFVYIFIVHGLLGLFGLYRMAKRTKPSDVESQYVPLPRNISPAGMELNPKTEPLDE